MMLGYRRGKEERGTRSPRIERGDDAAALREHDFWPLSFLDQTSFDPNLRSFHFSSSFHVTQSDRKAATEIADQRVSRDR